MTPVRVGLMPTCLRVTSESAAILAPTKKNAADDISLGTSIWVAVKSP